MKRKVSPVYKRNKGRCSLCDSDIGPFTIKTLANGIIKYYECHACQVKGLLIAEAPSPKKRKVIREGLADANAGRTSEVAL